MEKVKSDIIKRNPDKFGRGAKGEVVIIQADFDRNCNIGFYENIFDQIKDFDIAVAVINAGFYPLGNYE